MIVGLFEEENELKGTPWTVYTLIAINSAIFLAIIFLPSYEHILDTLGFIPAHWTWLTLFTAMFLHAGLGHVAGNMFFLWMFGDNVEDVVGPAVFLAVYFLSGLGATGLHYLASPDSTIPCVGASGAISGVLAAYVAFFPWKKAELMVFLGRIELKTFHTTMVFGAAAWFAEQGLLGYVWQVTGLSEYGGIAFWAHVGGFVTGGALGLVLRWSGALQKYRKRRWGRTMYLRPKRRTKRRAKAT